jgi:1,2-dihydroxy-3-keto-5-methylthiopentene dioxygenase
MQLSWLDAPPQTPACTLEDLRQIGVTYRFLSTDPSRYEPALAELCQQNGYTTRDQVSLAADTQNLNVLLDKFKDEHLHEEDEVRFVLEGAGIFDLRSAADRWIRVEVAAGDVLVVPKGLYHRFFLTAACQIRCVRLFQDPAGWKPVYRQPPATTATTAATIGATP